jgi:predicted DNA-binding transcriptional regulator AlpA
MSNTLASRLPTPVTSQVYYLRDMCSLYNVSDCTIHKWVKQKKLPAPGKIGSRPVWSREAVDAHLASLRGGK